MNKKEIKNNIEIILGTFSLNVIIGVFNEKMTIKEREKELHRYTNIMYKLFERGVK